jgi:P pilus assembly chaperone PapD
MARICRGSLAQYRAPSASFCSPPGSPQAAPRPPPCKSPLFFWRSWRGAAATVTLRNNGAKPIATQIRVFRWIQEAGRERLEPTEDVVASPPAVELQPAQDYVARVVRVTKKPVEGEEAYRLFIDELPEAPQGQRTVNLVVRHSIPLFFDAPGNSRARSCMARDAERARRLA